MALVLWMNSEVSLYQADELACRYTRRDDRVSEMIANQIRCTNDTYVAAMKFALAAVCHYEKHTPSPYQTSLGQRVLAVQAQRILTHYRQRMVRSVDACNVFEMPPLSQLILLLRP